MKLLSNLFIAFILFTFVACGGGESTDSNSDTEEGDSTATEAEADVNAEESEDVEPTAEMSESAQAFVNKWALISMTHIDESEEKDIDNAFLNLKADGTFEEIFAGKPFATGTWTVEGEGEEQALILKHLTGDMSSSLKDGIETLGVKEVSAEKLVTVDDDGKMTETFTPAPAE